jgi:hypothetical protein
MCEENEVRFLSKLLACDEGGINCTLNIKDEFHRAVKKYNFDLNDSSTTWAHKM